MFETLGTGWGRFAQRDAAGRRARRARLAAATRSPTVRRVENLAAPAPMVAPLARVVGLLARARAGLTCPRNGVAPGCFGVDGDLALSLETARAARAARAALGGGRAGGGDRAARAARRARHAARHGDRVQPGEAATSCSRARRCGCRTCTARRRRARRRRSRRTARGASRCRSCRSGRACRGGWRTDSRRARHVHACRRAGSTAANIGDRRGSRRRHARARRAAHRGRVVRRTTTVRSCIASPIRRAASCVGPSRRCRRSACCSTTRWSTRASACRSTATYALHVHVGDERAARRDASSSRCRRG